MTLSYTTIIAGRPGRAAYFKGQCDGLLNKLQGKTVRTAGSRSLGATEGSEPNRRAFLTVATSNNRVAAFIELRTVAGSSVFQDDLLLNAIDGPVWDSPRTVEIAALGVNTKYGLNPLPAEEIVASLLERTSAYLWPLGIRRMVVRCSENDLDLFSAAENAV